MTIGIVTGPDIPCEKSGEGKIAAAISKVGSDLVSQPSTQKPNCDPDDQRWDQFL
jgi:hypothetical protein